MLNDYVYYKHIILIKILSMVHVSEENDRYITRQTLPQILAGAESSDDGKFPTHTSILILQMYTTSH